MSHTTTIYIDAACNRFYSRSELFQGFHLELREVEMSQPIFKKPPSSLSGWEEILVGRKFLMKKEEILRGRGPEFWGKIY